MIMKKPRPLSSTGILRKIGLPIHAIAHISIVSLIHSMWLRLSGRDYIITGECSMCGCCCQRINLKYRRGWIRRESQFHELIEQIPEYSRFSVLPEEQTGTYLNFSCSWYDPQYGCSDYDNRLDICRNYPGKSLPVQGGKLLPGCGYRFKEGIPFDRRLAKEMKKIQRK